MDFPGNLGGTALKGSIRRHHTIYTVSVSTHMNRAYMYVYVDKIKNIYFTATTSIYDYDLYDISLQSTIPNRINYNCNIHIFYNTRR